MKDEKDSGTGSLRVSIVNWRQRVYIFPHEVFPDKPIFYKQGDQMEDSRSCKELYGIAQMLLKLDCVLGVLYFGFSMIVFKDNDRPWEGIDETLKGALDKYEFPRPILPVGTMQQGWEVIPFHADGRRVDFIIEGRKLMTHLNGKKFTRADWDEAIREDRTKLEHEMRPRGFQLTERLFKLTEASSVIMMSTQISLEFAKVVDAERVSSLKFLVSRLIREIG
jgi:hypothetical protein